jgi:hypothetical protein
MIQPDFEQPQSVPVRREPEDAPPRQSAPELERDEPFAAQIGEDPGTLDPDE